MSTADSYVRARIDTETKERATAALAAMADEPLPGNHRDHALSGDWHGYRECDPVAPAKRSASALAKIARRTLDDGTPVHSFRTLLEELATVVRNTCRTRGSGDAAPTFEIVTAPNPKQAHAIELLQAIAL